MSTFDGNTIQTTDGAGLAETATDHNLPVPGSLRLNDIKFGDALAGTRGVDCKLIHGDIWEEIVTNPTWGTDGLITGGPEVSLGNMTTNVAGDQTLLVVKNQQTTLHGNVTYTFLPQNADPGVYNEFFMGPVNRTFMQTVTENYHADLQIHQPDDGHFEFKKYDHQMISVSNIFTEVQLEYATLHAELCLLHMELAAIHFELKPIHFALDLIKTIARVNENKVDVFKNDILPMNLRASVIANAGPSPNALTIVG
jgi:hypothetical protein